jgi:hypothetical protein
MVLALLLHRRNEQLRRIAQEIAVPQQQEIVVMGLAVHPPSSVLPSAAEPTIPARVCTTAGTVGDIQTNASGAAVVNAVADARIAHRTGLNSRRIS